MLATGAWRSAAAFLGAMRLYGQGAASGPTAALWAAIDATVYNANTMASAITMNHAREPDF